MARTQRYVTRTAAGGGDGSSGTPWTLDEAIAAATPGDDMNLLNDGTDWTWSSLKIWAATGTVANPVRWRGYTSTVGDWWQGFNADGTIDDTNFPVLSGGRVLINNYHIFEGIRFDLSTADSAAAFLVSGQSDARMLRIDASHSNSDQAAAQPVSGGRIMLCDIYQTHATSTAAALLMGGYSTTFGNRLTSLAGSGIRINTTFGAAYAARNLIVDCGAHGVNIKSTGASDHFLLSDTTIVGCAGNGVDVSASFVGRFGLVNSIVRDSGGYGIDLNGSAGFVLSANNRFYNNTSGDWDDTASNSYLTQVGAITGAGVDFVDAAGGDWRLLRASLALDATKRGMSLGASHPLVGGILGYGHA